MISRVPRHLVVGVCVAVAAACARRPASEGVPQPAAAARYDVVIRGGTVYDGSGGAPVVADVAVVADSVVAVGPSLAGRGRAEVDARGLAVAPGFINML